MNKYTPWNMVNSSVGTFSGTGKSINIYTGGRLIPLAGNGNSPYDTNWNIVSMGNPIQLVIPNGMNPFDLKFTFRIPETEPSAHTGTSIVYANSGIIMWTFTSTGNSLFSS